MTDRNSQVRYSLALVAALLAGSPLSSSIPALSWRAAPQTVVPAILEPTAPKQDSKPSSAQTAPAESVPTIPDEPPRLRDPISVPTAPASAPATAPANSSPASTQPSSAPSSASVVTSSPPAPAPSAPGGNFRIRAVPPLLPPIQGLSPRHFPSIRHQTPDAAHERALLDQYKSAKKQHGVNSSQAFSKLLALITYYLQTQQMKSVVELGSEVDATFSKLPAADQQEFATILLASAVEVARMRTFDVCKALYDPVVKAAAKADWKNAQALGDQLSILADQLAFNRADSAEPLYECADMLLERPPVSGQPGVDKSLKISVKLKLIASQSRIGKHEKVAHEAETLLAKTNDLTANQRLVLLEQLLAAYGFLDKPNKLKALEPKIASTLEDVDTSQKWSSAEQIIDLYIKAGQPEPAQALAQSLALQSVAAPESDQQTITAHFDRIASVLSRNAKRDIAAKMYELVSDRTAAKFGRYSTRHLEALIRQTTFLKRQQMTLESEKIFEEFQKNRPKPQTDEQRVAQIHFLEVFAFQDRDRVISIVDEILNSLPNDGNNTQTYREAAQLFDTARDQTRAQELYKKALDDLSKSVPKEDALVTKYLPRLATGRSYLLQELFRIVGDSQKEPRTGHSRSIEVVVANLLDSANAHDDAKELLQQYIAEQAACDKDSPRLPDAVFAYASICQREHRPRLALNSPDYLRPALLIAVQSAVKHAWGNNPGVSGNEPATIKFNIDRSGITDVEVEKSGGSKAADDELIKLLQSLSNLRGLTSATDKTPFHATFDFRTVTVTVN